MKVGGFNDNARLSFSALFWLALLQMLWPQMNLAAEKEMATDDQIRAIAKKVLGREMEEHGSMLELSEKNRPPIKEIPIQSLADVFKLIGIDPEKTHRIEGIGVNTGVIARYRISNSYDLIYYGWSIPVLSNAPRKPHIPLKREAIFKFMFFIPHSDGKYEGKLFTQARWDEVIFK